MPHPAPEDTPPGLPPAMQDPAAGYMYTPHVLLLQAHPTEPHPESAPVPADALTALSDHAPDSPRILHPVFWHRR